MFSWKNRHVGLHALRHVPRDPLGPHLASPNRVLGRGPDGVMVPHASLSCGTILLCDLSPLAARALFPAGTPSFFGGCPFRVLSQYQAKKINQSFSSVNTSGEHFKLVLREDVKGVPAKWTRFGEAPVTRHVYSTN